MIGVPLCGVVRTMLVSQGNAKYARGRHWMLLPSQFIVLGSQT